MRKDILIVDSDKNEKVLESAWGRIGCHVLIVSGMHAACVLLEEQQAAFRLMVIRAILSHDELISGIRWIRRSIDMPMLIYTSEYEETNCAECILAGADIYLPFPKTVNEEVYAGYALLRRQKIYEIQYAPQSTLEFGCGLIIHLKQRCAIFKGVVMKLQRREFDLLCLLARNMNIVLEHSVIYENVWRNEYDSLASSNQLRTAVNRLRQAFFSIDRNADYIKTEKYIGYHFTVPIV